MPPTVTNAQVLQAISDLSRQVQQRDEPLEARLDEVTIKLGELERGQAALERSFSTAMAKEAKRDACPFRDEIVAGANKERRLSAAEKGIEEALRAIHSVELKIAGWSVLGGGAISAIVAVVDRIIDAAQGGGA